MAAESRYAILRIYDINSPQQQILSKDILWGTVSPFEERCWPAYWISKGRHRRLLEEYYPIKADIALRGWGKFRVSCSPLSPSFKMYWGGKYWYVDDEGRAWLASLSENRYIHQEKADSLPVLSWSSDRQSPLDINNKKGNILISNLQVKRIMSWYENIELLGWLGNVQYVHAGMKEGRPVVTLEFRGANGGHGVSVIFDDDPEKWYETGLAVKKIYPDMSVVDPNLFVDTTYEGKILVKKKIK